MEKELTTGCETRDGEALCDCTRCKERQRKLTLSENYWQSCQEQLRLYQERDQETWIFYQ